MIRPVEDPKLEHCLVELKSHSTIWCPPPYSYATILYMTTLPFEELRARLSKLVADVSATYQRIEITQNEHRAAMLLGVGAYDAIREINAVISDSELLRAHGAAVQELANGDTIDASNW